ncbi:unnamed protein product [Prunus armeniaca]
MSRTPMILPLIADSKKHAVNPAGRATRTHTSIATTKGSTFHTSSQKSTWIIDSGATDHMTFDPSQLISRKSSTLSVVSNANGTPSPVVGEGSLSLSTSLHLDSERRLVVVLDGANFTTWTRHRIMRSRLVKLSEPMELVLRGRETKFGYGINVLGMPRSCDTCELANSHHVPFPLSSNKSLVPFFLIHYDVWGPAKIATPAGTQWFVTFIDDCTRMTWVSLLKTKGEVSSRFQQFYQMVETQFHARIQILRSNNGGEFLNHDLS